MARVGPPDPRSPFTAIMGWCENWPLWQRDALRRIICFGTLTPTDIDELESICRAAFGAAPKAGPLPKAEPLGVAHLPVGPDAGASVSLARLGNLKGVNRLPDDQVLSFCGPTGLTIIYGENGVGKSGYARVIKKACRARGTPQPIKPDVFASSKVAAATADIVFRVGTIETPAKWRDDAASDPRLASILVFDSQSAKSHVAEDGPASFVPRGLDVLPKLARACDEIKKRLNSLIDAETSAIEASKSGWAINHDTAVGSLLASLDATADVDAIKRAAVFEAKDKSRLRDLTAALRDNPKTRSAQTSQMAKRIRDFAAEVERRQIKLSDGEIKKTQKAIERADAAQAAAKAAAKPLRALSDLPGTYGDAWRQLWEIARQFAVAVAYPDQTFPNQHAEAKCVLCQQILDEPAKERFARFDAYVRDEARKRAREAAADVATLTETFSSLGPLRDEFDALSADLAAAAEESVETIQNAVSGLDLRLSSLLENLKGGRWTDVAALSPSVVTILQTTAVALEKRAAMELTAHDPAKRMTLEAERRQLEDREWLSKSLSQVLAVIARLKAAAKLKRCKDDCTTNKITLKSGELEEAHVTSAFRAAFQTELRALGMKTLNVKLDSGKPALGQRRHGVRLDGVATKANGDPLHKVEEIVSEGEHRCIALAVFLAELSQASHNSAIVIDDPVSSLDHAKRTAVALRLLKEASVRQVVVFTHDAVFLCELLEAAEKAQIEPVCRHLAWNGPKPGFCEDGIPWDWQQYKGRIDSLEKDYRRLKASWSVVPNPSNVADMRRAYSHLRATLERILQDVIFNSVIARYRSWVRVDKLDEVVGFCQSECDAILHLHKRTCDVTDAHDPATGKQAAVPDPVELLADIEALKELVEQVKLRRASAKTAKAAAGSGTSAPGTAKTKK